MITKRSGKFVLHARSTGKVLGTHPTRKAAERQEAAINIAKARAAGHKIPKKK